MKLSRFILFLFLGMPITPAFGHRLDKFLQATTISVESNQVILQLHLTPGVSIADRVLTDIGAGQNGTISEASQRAYAGRVGRDLSLAVDGHPLPLHLVSFSFPEVQELTNGVGEIQMQFQADLPKAGSTGKLTLENRHDSDIAAYLVNTLVPEDPQIHILKQTRNYNQSLYQLDFAVGEFSVATQATAPGGFRRWLEQTGNWSVLESYFVHGVRHILTGYDHLLFICALVLGAATLWDLIKVVTAFTLAHTMTLTLAALGLVHLPAGVVEPLISASIVFVAVQNIFWPDQARGWSRLGAAFFFGLFHGLGFAGGLLDAMHAMPGTTMLLALVGFTLGVEAGHQIVILPLFGLLKALRRPPVEPVKSLGISPALQRVGSGLISLAGIYYLCVALRLG